MTSKELSKHLLVLDASLGAWQPHFPDEVGNLRALKQEFSTRLARFEAEEQTLRIGIMGQVKAGKSSFLNALLFDGYSVLPEAATPKTANLTRIGYGEQPRLIVSYYSLEEWNEIERQANSGGDHIEARVGRDLLAMAKAGQLDVRAILARGEETIDADDLSGIMARLNDYVGENGRYTALVKMTELQLPREELKGFEVIDTPGMNDPVPSRTQKTREFMAECDVVFFLSRCSQFLDQSDADLLAAQLPGKGVKQIVLIAGQLDSALLDDGWNRASLAETEKNVKTRLSRTAQSSMGKLVQLREENGQTALAQILRKLQTPVFASSYAQGFANWPSERWQKSTSMAHVFEQMARLARQTWGGALLNQADWDRIGNFKDVRQVYEASRASKQALLQAQREGILPETCEQLRLRVGALQESLEIRRTQLQTGSLKDLEVQQKKCLAQIERLSASLAKVINRQNSEIANERSKRLKELRSGIEQASELKTRQGSESHTTSYEVSTSAWYKPWTWWSSETCYRTYTTNYEYIAAADAIEQLSNYANDNAERLERAFSRVISTKALCTEFKKELIQALDTSSSDFDPKAFRHTLENALDKLVLPELHLDMSDVGRKISQSFKDEVRDSSEMNRLRTAMQSALKEVFQFLSNEFAIKTDALVQALEHTRDSLGTVLSASLNRELEALKAAFADKERELAKYATLETLLQETLRAAEPAQRKPQKRR